MDLDQTQAINWDQYEDSTDDELDTDPKPVAHLKVMCQRGFPETLFPIHQGDNLIGRSDTCNVHVPLTSLSKKHACIEVRGDTHFIYDCGSRNRTRRGEKLFLVPNQRYELQHGVKLYFADVSCEYVREEQPAVQESADDSGSETGSESLFTGLSEEQQPDNDKPNQIPKTPAGPTLEQTRLYVEESDSDGEGGGRKSINTSDFIVQDSQPTPQPGKLAIPLVFGTPEKEENPVQKSFAILESSEEDDDDRPLLDDTDIAGAPTQAYALNSSVDTGDDEDSLPDIAMEPTQAYVLNSSHEEDNFADCPTQAYGLDSDTDIEEADDGTSAPTQPVEGHTSERITNGDRAATQECSEEDIHVPTDEVTQPLQDSIDRNEPTQTVGDTLPFTSADQEEPPPTLPVHPHDEMEGTLPVAALGDTGKADEQATLMIRSEEATLRSEGSNGTNKPQLNKNRADSSQGFVTSENGSKPKAYPYDTDSETEKNRNAFEEATQAYALDEEGIEEEMTQTRGQEERKEHQIDNAEESTQAYKSEEETLEPETQSFEEGEEKGNEESTQAYNSNEEDTVEETQASGDSDVEQGKDSNIAEAETQAYGDDEDTDKGRKAVSSTDVDDDDFANMETQAYGGEDEEMDDLANAATQAYGLFQQEDETPETDEIATAETLAYGEEDLMATQACGVDTDEEPTQAETEESRDIADSPTIAYDDQLGETNIAESPTMAYEDQLGETQAYGIEEEKEEVHEEEEVVPETQEDDGDAATPIPLPPLKSALHSPDHPRRQVNRVGFTDRVRDVEPAVAPDDQLVETQAYGVAEDEQTDAVVKATTGTTEVQGSGQDVEPAAASESDDQLMETQAYGLEEGEEKSAVNLDTEEEETKEEGPTAGAKALKVDKSQEMEEDVQAGSKKGRQKRGGKIPSEEKTSPELEDTLTRRRTRGHKQDDSEDKDGPAVSLPAESAAEKPVRLGRGRRSAPPKAPVEGKGAEDKPQSSRRAGRSQQEENEKNVQAGSSNNTKKPKTKGRKSEPAPSTSKSDHKEESTKTVDATDDNQEEVPDRVQDIAEGATIGRTTKKARGRKSEPAPSTSKSDDMEETTNTVDETDDNQDTNSVPDIAQGATTGRTTRKARGKKSEPAPVSSVVESTTATGTRGKGRRRKDNDTESVASDVTDDLEEARPSRRSVRGKQKEDSKAKQGGKQEGRRRTRGRAAKDDDDEETGDGDEQTDVNGAENISSDAAKGQVVEEDAAPEHLPATRRGRGRKSVAASTRRGKASAVEKSAEDSVESAKSVENEVPKIVVSEEAPGPSGRQTRKRKGAAVEENETHTDEDSKAQEAEGSQKTKGKRGRQASKEETKETAEENSQPRGRGRKKTTSGQKNEGGEENTLSTASQSTQSSSATENADLQETTTSRKRGRSGQKSAESAAPQVSAKLTPPETPAVLSSPSQRTRRAVSGDSKPRIMFTGVVDRQGEKIVKDLGGDLVDSVINCTHLVTDKVRRTVKFLCLLARGQLIVSTDWLDRCKDCRTFLDAAPFMIKDPATEKQYNFSLATSHEKARDAPMLEGYRLHVTAGVRPDPTQMKDIINCAGGEFLKTMPKTHTDGTVVVSCEADRKQCDPALKAGIPVVTAEFLLTGILRQEVDVEAHRLFADFDRGSNKRKSTAPAADTGKRSRRR
ncbi:mediator of DNA damage checkpoint protein 1-like [Branchiostoma floridae]|uniref:Mediator of DNA damage checkpoint protein 1 n=1 Tax=Branchiostoma floridae TaxID=7739 RepID=A0A9J7MDX5_BRAFL|nr:mediator of DNA damage checkpoint protein 1-like [Branchiostoma floridae]